MSELKELIGKIDNDIFWEWVSGWYDEDNILRCIDDWEEKLQNEAVEEINKLIKKKKKEDKICCNKPMIYLGNDYFGNSQFKEWLCSKCGRIIKHENISYDDEELLNIFENYDEDFIRETEIYKKLKREIKQNE